ncbi:MAG: nucleotide sugar dehydrogenase [Saprospiraceae bacterium]
MFSQLNQKTAQLAVIGLGYVGLPVAHEFAKNFRVIGFDINAQKIKMMQAGIDPAGEIEAHAFDNKDIQYTHNMEAIKAAKFFVVAVPTPIDQYKQPDLKALKSATTCVAKVLKKGDYVVFESTVYPGCTEEVCVKILEEVSGLMLNEDFKVGYSPERINPGDKKNTIDKIVKLVSGSDAAATEVIAKVYGQIITAGVYQAPTIKVAEAAKIIENTQRDVNIALMNELSQIFDKLGINTYEVLKAAGTKWNFLNFYPGLVGGHCIGVDPYYLIQKAIKTGHNPILISAGRTVNDGMPAKIAQRIVAELYKRNRNLMDCRVLVQGITFKENVTDIRNSKAVDLVKELQRLGCKVDVVDPLASPKELRMHCGIELTPNPTNNYDAVVVAVSHDEYQNLEELDYLQMTCWNAFIYDIKGILKNKIRKIDYFSL